MGWKLGRKFHCGLYNCWCCSGEIKWSDNGPIVKVHCQVYATRGPQ
jgi:hypothetical protein